MRTSNLEESNRKKEELKAEDFHLKRKRMKSMRAKNRKENLDQNKGSQERKNKKSSYPKEERMIRENLGLSM